MRETTVEEYLDRRVKETGGFTRKVVWPGRRGAPDRLVGWPRTAVRSGDAVHGLVEMKKPKGPGAEDHQLREHDRLRAIGFRVDVIHTKEAVDAYVLEMTS